MSPWRVQNERTGNCCLPGVAKHKSLTSSRDRTSERGLIDRHKVGVEHFVSPVQVKQETWASSERGTPAS